MKHWQLYIKRKELGKSQGDIAKMLGISTGRYQLKETLQAEFTLAECRKLAKYFDTTLDELFTSDAMSEVG